MKARKVKGLDPRAALADNAARIVATRLDELRSLAPQALGRDETVAQHDMRIAAKRLRYVLETVGICFGDPADAGRRAARDIQGLLGDLHDCDVLVAILDARAPGHGAPATDHGVELLVARTIERRDRLHADFEALWSRLERDGVWAGLEEAL